MPALSGFGDLAFDILVKFLLICLPISCLFIGGSISLIVLGSICVNNAEAFPYCATIAVGGAPVMVAIGALLLVISVIFIVYVCLEC